MIRISAVMFLMAVCAVHTAFSLTQPSDSVREEYIQEYPDKFYIKPVYSIRNHSLKIRSRTENIQLNFRPNDFSYFGVNFYVFEVGVGFSFRIPKSSESFSRYGETEFLDLHTNIYAKKWGADLSLQHYQGFYIHNPKAHFPGWNRDDPYPQRGDLIINTALANIFYIENNRNFSYRSAYNQADRQLKNSGSFLFGAKLMYQDISADTSLIPFESRRQYNVDNFRSASFYSIGLLPGYTYNFVHDYFFLNLSIAGGPVYNLNFYAVDKETTVDQQIRATLNFRAAAGYNSPDWFAGISFVNHNAGFTTDRLKIQSNTQQIQLFIGYRFEEVGILKKTLL